MDSHQLELEWVTAPTDNHGATVRDARHDQEERRIPRTGIRLVMLGRPGCGKGTQAERFAEILGVPHIALGDVLRAAVRAGLPLDCSAEPYLSAGQLLADGLVGQLTHSEIASGGSSGFVLDGFPRTLAQAAMLATIIAPSELDAAVHLVVGLEEAVRRMQDRRLCPECELTTGAQPDGACPECSAPLSRRSDDIAETIEHRLGVFDREMQEVLRWYSGLGLLTEVDGHGPVEEVTLELLRSVFADPTARSTIDERRVVEDSFAPQEASRAAAIRGRQLPDVPEGRSKVSRTGYGVLLASAHPGHHGKVLI
jgi:adenylate kinase